jgi:hypothetical protein
MDEEKLASLSKATQPSPSSAPQPAPAPAVDLEKANEKLSSLLNKPK